MSRDSTKVAVTGGGPPLARALYLHHEGPPGSTLVPLRDACLAISPRLAAFSRALFLDLGLTSKAWKGEAKQLSALRELLDIFQVHPRVVVGDRAAWLPAFAIGAETVHEPGSSERRLALLPIERLALLGDPHEAEAEALERTHLTGFMRRVGMNTIGDFLRLRPEAVLRRFGKTGGRLRAWATGERELVLPHFTVEDPLEDSIDADEITGLEQLLFLARQRFVRLEARLDGRGQLAQEVRMTFSFYGKPPLVKSLSLAEPLKDTAAFLRLLRDFLDGVTWDAPLTRLTLELPRTVPHRPGQLSLFDDALTVLSDLGQYVSRLRARFGDDAVGFAELKESYVPERSFGVTWPPQEAPPVETPQPERPFFIFDPPRPFTPPSGGTWEATERVSAEWWSGTPDRHYFVYRTPTGERLWVYWDTSGRRWFLQGKFE